jgi:hypothetical protein
MSSSLRRAVALGLVLALAVPTVAAADTVFADGDALSPGNQMTVHLGEVAPGAMVPVDVAMRLTCKNSSHVAAGSTIAVTVTDQVLPVDGSATSTPGSINIPADWPAPGTGCPEYGLPTTLGTVPVHLDLTAPTTPGTGYEFTFLFEADPATGISNMIAFTATLDVVEPGDPVPPADTTAPVLHGIPADMTVLTPGTAAVVTYATPTATDDTDPSPTVTCDPASGSDFPPGTTTVICTAADASGNTAEGSFNVTVRQLAAIWGRPLDTSATPALVGQLGRTIPLKLTVTAGAAARGAGEMAAPTLTLERLATSTMDASVMGTGAGGTFAWTDGTWHLNLRTAGLAPGAWRLTAVVDGAPLATAIVVLAPDAPTKAANRTAR